MGTRTARGRAYAASLGILGLWFCLLAGSAGAAQPPFTQVSGSLFTTSAMPLGAASVTSSFSRGGTPLAAVNDIGLSASVFSVPARGALTPVTSSPLPTASDPDPGAVPFTPGGGLFAAATDAGGGASVEVVTRASVVGASATATFRASCPTSHPHPVGGEFGYIQGIGVPYELELAASYPRGRKGWLVAVKNLVEQPQGYIAGIVCVRAKARFAYPGVTFVITMTNRASFNVYCPATAPRALGAYFGPQSTRDLGDTSLSDNGAGRLSKRDQGAYAIVDDSSSLPIGVFSGASCSSLNTTEVQTPYKSLASGVGAFWNFTCPHQTPFAVGSVIVPKRFSDGGALAPAESFSSQNGHKWFVALKNLSDHSVDYFAGAVCIG